MKRKEFLDYYDYLLPAMFAECSPNYPRFIHRAVKSLFLNQDITLHPLYIVYIRIYVRSPLYFIHF